MKNFVLLAAGLDTGLSPAEIAGSSALARLGSANDGLSRNQQAAPQRLDHQADVIRDLTSAVTAQQNRWSQYRSAVKKLKEITDSSSLPARLPDNL